MILFLYNLGLLVALVLGAPWWLWQMATTQKYREGLRARLGGVPERFAGRHLDAGGVRSGSRRTDRKAAAKAVIWLHAVSVGEVLAVSRLVAELDAQLLEFQVLMSTTTRTGQAVGRERFGAERVFYCPLDLPWAVASYLNALKPAMLVLAETEFWPNLLAGCYRRGIPVVVVNARISDRSWPRYQRLRGLWRPFLSRLRAVLAQTETDAKRLRALGCLPERVAVSGNLKFDVRAGGRVGGRAAATEIIDELAKGLRLVVAGSTLEGEEAMLLAAWPAILAGEPDLAMVLAPRHPERFAAVAELLARSGFPWRRRTLMEVTSIVPDGLVPGELVPGEIVLLDSIGELASVYSLAAVAFVGGSLVPAGGHNPLEPAQFGVPVVMGEHYANFRGIVEAMRSVEAVKIARSEELAEAIAVLLVDRQMATAMGQRGRQVFEEQAGATDRTVAALREILKERGVA
jgi:3-deoxy-D-manno-octulosonic-acid transferase